jgi:hypothetical protein
MGVNPTSYNQAGTYNQVPTDNRKIGLVPGYNFFKNPVIIGKQIYIILET